jgi:hypothetical protein
MFAAMPLNFSISGESILLKNLELIVLLGQQQLSV